MLLQKYRNIFLFQNSVFPQFFLQFHGWVTCNIFIKSQRNNFLLHFDEKYCSWPLSFIELNSTLSKITTLLCIYRKTSLVEAFLLFRYRSRVSRRNFCLSRLPHRVFIPWFLQHFSLQDFGKFYVKYHRRSFSNKVFRSQLYWKWRVDKNI